MSESWVDLAACRGMATERGYELFYEEEFEDEAKRICEGCNVRVDCLHEALTNGVWSGVYGGMNPKEREGHYRRWRYATRQNGSERSRESLLRWNQGTG